MGTLQSRQSSDVNANVKSMMFISPEYLYEIKQLKNVYFKFN